MSLRSHFLCSSPRADALGRPGREPCGSAALVPACCFATLRCRAYTPLLHRPQKYASTGSVNMIRQQRAFLAPLTRFVGGPRPLRCALGAPISPGLPPHARFSRSRYARGERYVATLRFFFCWALVGSAAMASGSAAAVAYASPFGLGAACPRFPPLRYGKTGAASSCPGGWRFSVGRRA